MRDIIFYEYKWDTMKRCNVKVEVGKAKFHQFGVNYEEFENGPGNFSTAIIEKEDGSVDNIPVELIKFI